ncbi:hypothetical protein GLOIN_2v1762352 [Rhizophagus irregularis DAOM 181602=DAOM 197198]|uniref:Uncharacterized protein n=1 Tax=Rhizophagus irregularis (strain DAOM 181602 / DAOM 197198 / MUCL 43194) TaxID=747089 RepID=A0A2P4QX09_RHIID|nr:hypothetical protein GLOIN_2v1762352 [Rhizophagus irregularis DAOM 181602=DAOM 197198]POG82157.1 hypothetical protein GLOIN_2v1762352 [Rhizophagus irregularis DAOM 181602=DAOM 197198]|eukprot:XP_025189023.1 hypothetical protein GLOIN_2v1762352 [Rhizophagus irregularis DAOM 181602=DAOM 197198]
MLDCETDNTNTKSLEDGKTMLSWDEVHKKKVSNEIRQRKREEKFQRESSDHKQENIGYNNSSNDSGERIPEESIHSEDDKTVSSKIYNEMKSFLPNITDVNLHKKTERARKILELFGKGGVGIDRIKYVTYSASAISG